MKTVNISTKAKTINSLLKKAQRGGLILRSPEGQEFMLAEINDFNREIELTRQNKALMKLLDSRGKQSKTFKASDVKKQIRSGLAALLSMAECSWVRDWSYSSIKGIEDAPSLKVGNSAGEPVVDLEIRE